MAGSNLWDEFDLEEVYNFLKDHYSSSRLSQQGINQPEEVRKNGLSIYILVVTITEKAAKRILLYCYKFLLQIDDFFVCYRAIRVTWNQSKAQRVERSPWIGNFR